MSTSLLLALSHDICASLLCLRNFVQELNITVEDSMYRWSAWEITASNIPFRKHPIHERFCLWDVTLAPGGAEKISYSVEFLFDRS